MHIHDLIEDSAALANLCSRLSTAPFVVVDTEFMRENSYWPEICLIQIADENEAAAVDPLAPGMEITPLLDLLTKNHDVPTVFPSGGTEFQIVYIHNATTPTPLF